MSNLESAVSLKGVKESHFHGCLYIEMTMQFNKHLHSAFDGCFHLKHLTVHSMYTFFISMRVPWLSNPQPLRLYDFYVTL